MSLIKKLLLKLSLENSDYADQHILHFITKLKQKKERKKIEIRSLNFATKLINTKTVRNIFFVLSLQN